MTEDRKKVPYIERLAISNALRASLAELGPDGTKLRSQFAIGVGLGVSQESARRALVPAGVGPAIRKTAPEYLGMTIEQLVERYGKEQPEVESIFNEALGELVSTGMASADEYKQARLAVSLEGLDDPSKLTVSIAKEMIVAMLNAEPEDPYEPPAGKPKPRRAVGGGR